MGTSTLMDAACIGHCRNKITRTMTFSELPGATKRPLLNMVSQAMLSLYCVQDTRAHTWRVQTVPVEPGSFQSRKPLPKAWMGLRDKELDAESGISGCVFVHASGFIGGNKTYEGTLEMAKQGLALP